MDAQAAASDGQELQFLAYAYHESYELVQSVHWHVAITFLIIGFMNPDRAILMAASVPCITTGGLGIVRRRLHIMPDRIRARRLGSQIAWVSAVTTVPAANYLCSLCPELKPQAGFMLFYWLLFFTFATWLQINALTASAKQRVYVWLVVCNLATPSWSLLTEYEDACALAIVLSASILFGRAIEAHHRATFAFRLQAEAERLGDSRLNHVLKNKTCAASFLLERVCKQLEDGGGSGEGGEGGEGGDGGDGGEGSECGGGARPLAGMHVSWAAQLRSVQGMLHQNADWCHLRELFVQLQTGVYTPVSVLTDLRSIVERVAGRPVHGGSGASIVPTVRFEAGSPQRLQIDHNILMLCLEEAFSNIAKYADAALCPTVRLEVVDVREPAEDSSTSNRADVYEWLHVHVDSVNRSGMRALGSEECHQLMARGAKALRLSGLCRDDASASESLSDGIGLDSVKRACQAVGGEARLLAYTDEGGRAHTVVSLTLPAHTRRGRWATDACSTSDSRGSYDGWDDGDDSFTKSDSFNQSDSFINRSDAEDDDAAGSPSTSPNALRRTTVLDKVAGKGRFQGGVPRSRQPLCVAVDDDPFMREFFSAIFLELQVGTASGCPPRCPAGDLLDGLVLTSCSPRAHLRAHLVTATDGRWRPTGDIRERRRTSARQCSAKAAPTASSNCSTSARAAQSSATARCNMPLERLLMAVWQPKVILLDGHRIIPIERLRVSCGRPPDDLLMTS